MSHGWLMSCRNTPISPSICRRTITRCATRFYARWSNEPPECPHPCPSPTQEERAGGRSSVTAQHGGGLTLLVVLDPQVRNLLLTQQIAQGILELGKLNEEVVLWVKERRTNSSFS